MINLISVVILMATLQCYAQNDLVRYRPCKTGCTSNTLKDDPIDGQFSYDDITTFETRDVVSDYGVRNAGKGATRFHQAIDYSPLQNNQDRGYALIAVKAGTVSNINGEDNYKGITIGNYRYTHIFKSELTEGKSYYKSGKFVLTKVQPKTGSSTPWAIIDLEYCRAFCQEAGRTVIVDGLPSTICESNTFPTINYVEEGWDIAPMGNSGGNFETHLHLERRENGIKLDPNQYVHHQSQDFDIELTTKDNIDIQLKYPGTVRNSLRLRATMKGGIALSRGNFENVTMNLDKADILLQRNGSNDYKHIVGFEGKKKAKIESKFWLGANHNTTIYPSDWSSRDFGTWTQTGTYPYAHNDANNQIYDDYFFADFYTRIHKDKHDAFTDIPSNARYNDGKYKLRSTVTNVRDALFEIPAIDITLDNFLPYLSDVNIKYNGDPLYQAVRVANEGTAANDDGYIDNQIYEYPNGSGLTLPNTLTIEIKTSEPMQNVRYALKKAGAIIPFPNPIVMIQDPLNRLLWTANVSSFSIERTCYSVEFKGEDLSGNALIHTYASTNQNASDIKMMIPTRKGPDIQDWHHLPVNTGADQIDFCLKDCDYKIWSDASTSLRGGGGINDCEGLTKLVSSVTFSSCIQAQIKLAGQGFNPSAFTIRWTDAQVNPLSQYDDMPVIDVTEAGKYCFRVEAKDDCCTVEGCVEVIQDNMDEASFELKSEIQHACASSAPDGSIDLDISGVAATYQVDWYRLSDDEPLLIQSHTGVTNGSGAEDLTGMPIGNYAVVVLDQNGCSQEASYEIINNGISIGLPDSIVICQPDTGEIIPEVSGGLGIYDYIWSTGDTEDAIYGLDTAGIYTVTVTDESGCSAVAEVALVASSPIVFADNFELHKPTSCDSEDGYISTWKVGYISGGTLPYSYLWNTDSTNNSIGPVVAGTYNLTVTDAIGCTAVKEQVLEAEYGIAIDFEFLQPTCPGQATGSIFLAANQDVIFRCEQLDITVQDENNHLFIDNLEAGIYCFSIISLDGLCEIERCFTLTDIVSFELLGVNTIKSCKFEKTGEAEVFHNSGSQISYIWKNIETNEIVSTSKQAKNLGQGRYSVHVKEFCGYNETIEVEIESDDFDVNFDIVNGCGRGDYDYIFDKYMGKFGTLNLTVNGMNPPYLVTLQASDDSRIPIVIRELVDVTNFIQITDLWDTEYNITISDADGCRYSNKFWFQSTIVSIDRNELIQPCSNGNNGVIKYDIFNPLGNQINVYYNEVMIFSTNNYTDVFFQTNQTKGISKLIWSIGDCYFNTSVTLEGTPIEKRLYKYNKNTNKCHYDEYCNDELLSKDTYLVDAFIDLADATTYTCNAPIYCGNIKVGVRDDKLTSIRGGEYYSLATSILPIHPYPQLINQDINKVLSYGPCRIWYFCPLSMRLWGTSPIAEGFSFCNKFFPGTWGESNIVDGSCVSMDCFCGPFLPPFCRENFDYPWGNPILILENCLPISINVGRLLLMKDELQNLFKDYSIDTELGIFINDILTSNEKRRKALCSNILFCRKDFTILYTDIDEPKLCGYDSNIKVTNNPNGFIISEAGKLEEISITSAYYPNCILMNSGFAICENSFPIVFCIEEYDENEPLPPTPTPKICPIFFKDTVRTTKRILNCNDETVSLVYNEERDEFIHFWKTNEDADTIFLYGDIKNNNLFQKQNIEFPKIALAPGSKIYQADLINGSVYISNEFQNRYYFTRYGVNGQLIWSKIFENDLVLKSNWLENGRIELLTYDKTNHKYKMLEISMEGQLSDTVNINTEIPANTVIHVNNKSVFYYLQNEHKLILMNSLGQNIVISLPTEFNPKAIKSLSNGNILLAGNYKEGFYYEGEQINSNGYANVILLQFTNNGNHVSSNIVPKDRDEFIDGFVIKGNNEVAYYGKYIEAVYSYYDSTNIRIDSCIFTGVFSIDTTICTTLASELTIDEELCQLTWLPMPEEYITTLEYLSADSIWTTAQPIEGQDGFTSPYHVRDDGIYRLAHRKVECPDAVSNEVNTSCHPISCPEIARVYDEEYQCYTFQIRHGENKEFRYIIRTWVYDTTALQFTDTVSFLVTDTSQIFSYCDLPEQYRCYNYGDIRILCNTCDSSCMQYYESWSCIPRTSTDESISDEYVKVRYYPNPFAGGVYLQYHTKASQEVAMSVYNSTGLLVLSMDIAIKEGDNLEYIKEIEALQPDVYTIQLKGASLINTSKVVKIR